MINPATELAAGKTLTIEASPVNNGGAVEEGIKRKRRSRFSQSRTSPQSDAPTEESAVNWRHDPTKYGSPLQSWKSAQKAIWTLYVVESEAGVKEMSGSRIAQ